MPSTSPLTTEPRTMLKVLLHSRMPDLAHLSKSRFRGMAQVDEARQSLLRNGDDDTQGVGEREVVGNVGDIDGREFNALPEAVLRMQGDHYGWCCDCQSAIPFDRLQAEPQALRCAVCQLRHDGRSKP